MSIQKQIEYSKTKLGRIVLHLIVVNKTLNFRYCLKGIVRELVRI